MIKIIPALIIFVSQYNSTDLKHPGKKSSRNLTADLMKGVAVVFMIQVHVTGLLAQQTFYDCFAGKLSLFFGGIPAAPVFMVVMGYYLRPSTPFFSELKRGLKLILWGLLLNIGLNFHLIIEVLAENRQADLLQYIFGADILFLAGMSVILSGLLKILFRNNGLPYFMLALVIAFLGPYVPVMTHQKLQYIGSFIGGNYSWSYFPLLPWLAYPLTGYSFRLLSARYGKYMNDKKTYFAAGSVVLFMVGLLLFGFKVSSNLPMYYHHGLVFYIWALLFLVCWLWVFDYLVKRMKDNLFLAFTGWMGENVTAIYVVQWLIIGNLATSIWKSQTGYMLIVWWLVIITVSSGLVYLKNLIKKYYYNKQEVGQ